MDDLLSQWPLLAAFVAGLFAQRKWLLWDKAAEKLK
jgi:hypothetical protein